MKIEKNIPAPTLNKGVNLKVASQMEIGDSVLCENISKSNSMQQALRRLGFGFVSQKQDDGTVRVWRIENKKK